MFINIQAKFFPFQLNLVFVTWWVIPLRLFRFPCDLVLSFKECAIISRRQNIGGRKIDNFYSVTLHYRSRIHFHNKDALQMTNLAFISRLTYLEN